MCSYVNASYIIKRNREISRKYIIYLQNFFIYEKIFYYLDNNFFLIKLRKKSVIRSITEKLQFP